jgi:hypothetical protein
MRFLQVFWCLDRLVVDNGPFFESQSDRYPVVFGGDCHDEVASGLAKPPVSVALVACGCVSGYTDCIGRWTLGFECRSVVDVDVRERKERADKRDFGCSSACHMVGSQLTCGYQLLFSKTGVDEFRGVMSECVNDKGTLTYIL